MYSIFKNREYVGDTEKISVDLDPGKMTFRLVWPIPRKVTFTENQILGPGLFNRVFGVAHVFYIFDVDTNKNLTHSKTEFLFDPDVDPSDLLKSLEWATSELLALGIQHPECSTEVSEALDRIRAIH